MSVRLPRAALVALILVVGLFAAFYWLDFRAARSETRVSSEVSTFGATGPNSDRTRLPRGEVGVYVPEDGELAAAVRRRLVSDLRSSPFFAGARVLDALPETAGPPALVVEVETDDATWTPVYSRAHLVVSAAFASHGDLSWRSERSIDMRGVDGPTLLVRGRFIADDATWGLTSYRSQRRHLGEQLAAKVGESLADALRSRSE